jgi:hypothetical protein
MAYSARPRRHNSRIKIRRRKDLPAGDLLDGLI